MSANAAERLSSLLLGQRLLGGGGDVLLFDEIEDLFSWSQATMFGGGGRATSHMSKQWFNGLLESNPVPTFWVTNRVEGIDAAFLRRFTYAIEVPSPGPRQRARVLARHLGPEASISAADAQAIARRFAASPGQFATAVAAARLVGGESGPDRATVESFLEPIDKLVGGDAQARPDPFDVSTFRLDGVRASEDLVRLADRLAAWRGGAGLPLLFHGLPGTGKSEYGRYLAHRMGRPLVFRRASDCLSMWVGESEKRIAAAFREAESEGAVLIFDEADSFLRSREGAKASWEVTQVNEFLQQLEVHKGVVICTTNLLCDLDAASLRRFVFKVGFRSAGPDEALALFSALLSPHLHGPLGPPEEAAIRTFAARSSQLAAGDFAAVARRLRALGDQVGVEACLDALAGEVRHKKERVAAGFG